jgi:hypothetical protein
VSGLRGSNIFEIKLPDQENAHCNADKVLKKAHMGQTCRDFLGMLSAEGEITTSDGRRAPCHMVEHILYKRSSQVTQSQEYVAQFYWYIYYS